MISYGTYICVQKSTYRMRAIISRGLYIFYPIFKDHFFVFKEVFSENSVLMYGLYSRAACNQERVIMARIRYLIKMFVFEFARHSIHSYLQSAVEASQVLTFTYIMSFVN